MKRTWNKVKAQKALDDYIYKLKSNIKNYNVRLRLRSMGLSVKDLEDLEHQIEMAAEWLDENPDAKIDEIEGKKEELDDICRPSHLNLVLKGKKRPFHSLESINPCSRVDQDNKRPYRGCVFITSPPTLFVTNFPIRQCEELWDFSTADLLLDELRFNVLDYSLSLVGKLKEFSSLPNLKMLLVPSFETAGLRPETDHLSPNANGILNVSAREITTGRNKSIQITNNCSLSKVDIEKMIKDVKGRSYVDEAQMRRSYGDLVIKMGMSLILSSPTEDPKWLHANIAKFNRTPLHKGNHLPNIHANVRPAPVVSSKTHGDSSSYIQAVKAGVNLHSVVSDAKVSKPALLLDDSCLNVLDYSLSLVGKLKEFSSLPNLKMLLVPSFETAGLRPETDHLSPSYDLLKKGSFFTRSWASRNKIARSSILGPASEIQMPMGSLTKLSGSYHFHRWMEMYRDVGDFNEVRHKDERYGSIFNARGADAFNSFISAGGLVEVPSGGYSFTWSHNFASKMSKLDHFLVSDNLSEARSPIFFSYFGFSISLEGFDAFVADIWQNITITESNAMIKLAKKLKMLKGHIRQWVKDCLGTSSGFGKECLLKRKSKKLGFGSRWRDWIQSCLNSSKGSILVNGSPTQLSFDISGSQQGDPLSPFLFILVSMGMSAFVLSKVVSLDNGCDSNILASGMRINLHKSKIMGIAIDNSLVTQVANSIGCLTLSLPFQYLGVNIGSHMSQIKSWDIVLNKVQGRLSKWKSKVLSVGGRLTLLKYVLGATPIYYMSMYKAPMYVINKLEAICSHFFNGGDPNICKMTFVKWENVLASKDKGGIGYIKKNVGNEEKTLFWYEPWKGDVSFNNLFPRLFALELDKKISVAGKMAQQSLITSFRRNPRSGMEASQMAMLTSLLEGIFLPNMLDRWCWSLSGDEEFSVSRLGSLYLMI
ncbi:RNA-directed DNA polymerase, eukaryota [Tanacetum coccineum]